MNAELETFNGNVICCAQETGQFCLLSDYRKLESDLAALRTLVVRKDEALKEAEFSLKCDGCTCQYEADGDEKECLRCRRLSQMTQAIALTPADLAGCVCVKREVIDGLIAAEDNPNDFIVIKRQETQKINLADLLLDDNGKCPYTAAQVNEIIHRRIMNLQLERDDLLTHLVPNLRSRLAAAEEARDKAVRELIVYQKADVSRRNRAKGKFTILPDGSFGPHPDDVKP